MSVSSSGVRFAPSPTGRFHLGNLRTAWISYALAKKLGQPWVVRFEDIDAPRVVAGAREQQLQDMAALGLVPDQILIQSELRARHWAVFEKAVAEGQVYPCFCSRKEISLALEQAASAPHGPGSSGERVYNGHCRVLYRGPGEWPKVQHPTIAWRFKASDESGRSDFIVARTSAGTPGGLDSKSFVPGYHWACAIDDLDGRYQLLVRASDLAHVVDQQRAIQNWLASAEGSGAQWPAVYHTALVTADDGSRLEKRTRGVTLQEVLDSGISVPDVLSRFSASFEAELAQIDSAQVVAGAVLGEKRERITVGELGFKVRNADS